ncbi:MAG: DUF488 domain-containing protein [Armatimonadota bacterium]|nr:DUF488 domain-containing protein [Armatimonadota bacterium]
MKLYTIGFTRTTAESFFSRLTRAGVKKVVDVRLNNASQLAGFAKKGDLEYFLRVICGIGYEHRSELAPTQEIFHAYKKRRIDWALYEQRFLQLMHDRRIEETLPRPVLEDACLLCSEHKPERCHRRLVAEYLRDRWKDVDIVHL